VRPPSRHSLAWRLVLIGFLQLFVLAAAVAGVGYLLRPVHTPHRLPEVWAAHPSEPWIERGPPHPRHPPVAPLATFLVGGLVIVGVGSYLTARWILGPLTKLSRAAAALGEGDLGVRVDLRRADELGDVGRSFDQMASRIQQLLKTERELLANVSHELRTPLARIRVALGLVERASDEERVGSLAEINEDLSEIEGLVNDIITSTRLQIEDAGRGKESRETSSTKGSGGFALHLEAVAPATLCDRSAERFRAHHPKRLLDVRVDPGLPAVRVDAVLLRRALDNALDNAHKYSPDPKTPVGLRARADDDDFIVFEVSDQGIGIPPEDRARIFEPFFRSDRSRSRDAGGVGLGLTLAKRIVEAHGGTIDAATPLEGLGTTLRIAVPAPAGLGQLAGAKARG
jgi:two-component system OmpR family sensor kinase